MDTLSGFAINLLMVPTLPLKARAVITRDGEPWVECIARCDYTKSNKLPSPQSLRYDPPIEFEAGREYVVTLFDVQCPDVEAVLEQLEWTGREWTPEDINWPDFGVEQGESGVKGHT